jgi:replicative DNA helicase
MDTNNLELELRLDPVKWAYWQLKDPRGNPWKARWYQKKLIKDIMNGTNRLAVRMGRRVGKTETMVVYCLWYAFHHKNARLLVCAPYENQVRLIFMRLFEMVDNCDELSAAQETRTKNPFILSFGNGSTIMGFTVGANSGNSGASIRGQRADWIFMDEIDYMNRDGIDAVTAIALEDPSRIGIWCSSTPTGKRDFFYEICNNPDTGYMPYHFPSMVNPDWNEMMEGELRATMTTQGYIHEVEADFGEETIGVFNKDSVERAYKQYLYSYFQLSKYEKAMAEKNGIKYEDIVFYGPYYIKKQAPPAYRVLAVDWDKYANATQIVITEYDQLLSKFRVCFRAEIPRSEFTLDNAVKKIIELNEIYNPQFIYCDRGFGEYQIEMLHLYGRENPETLLHKKVKGIQFAEVITIRDPGTNEIDKKDAKNFMINQTSILLDRDKIVLSIFDEMIWKQMMDYQVVRISQSGRPIYTSENEHALDAFMLTILGFTIEFPEITKILVSHQISSTVAIVKNNSGEKIKEKIFSEKSIFSKGFNQKEKERKDNPNWHWNKVPIGYSKKQNDIFSRGNIKSSGKRNIF